MSASGTQTSVIFQEKEKFFRSAFPIFIVLAVLVRFLWLSRFSFWLDEYTSVEVASKSISDILSGKGFDSHTPPFYYLVLHSYFKIIELFGGTISEFTVRFPSAIFDCGALFLVCSVTEQLFSAKTARLATLLYGFLEFPIYFAQEGRMYSLLALECLLTLRLLLPLERFSLLRAVCLAAVCSCGLYTHYYYAFFVLGLGIALLFELPKREAILAVGAFFAAGLVFLPWLNVLVHLAASSGQDFRPLSIMSLPYLLFRFLAGFALFPLDAVTKANQGSAISENLLLIGFYTALCGVMLAAGILALFRERIPARTVRYLLFPLLTSIVLPTLISFKVPMFSERYFSGIFPVVCILFALGISAASRFQLVLKTAIFGAAAYALYGHFGGEPRFSKEQWGQTVKYLRDRSETDALLIDPPFISPILKFYCPECRVTPLSKWDPSNLQGSSAVLLRRGAGETPNPAGAKMESEKTFPAESGLFIYRLRRTMTPEGSSDTVERLN